MASIDDLTEALFGICEDDGNTVFVDKVVAEAREAIASGSGTVSSIQNASQNGKSFGKVVHLGPIDVLNAARNARDRFKNGHSNQVSSTMADFGGIWR